MNYGKEIASLATLAATAMLAVWNAEAGLALSANGTPKAAVVIGNGDATIAYAATEMTNWVAKITGAELPVLADSASGAGNMIFIGTPETSPAIAGFAKAHTEDFSKLDGNDGFIIAEEKGNVFIAGSISRGARNGVYRFLEKNSDIIWARQLHGTDGGFGTIWSNDPNMKNTIDYMVDVPALLGRSWTGHGDGQLQWQQRLLNNDIRGRENDIGFGADLLRNAYGKSDPDIFPLIGGKRIIEHDCQLCLMNPKSLDLMEKVGLDYLKQRGITPTSVALNLGDNWSVCQCDLCMKPIKGDDGKMVEPTAKNFRSTQFAYFNMELYKRFRKHYPKIRPCLAPAYIWTAEPPAIKYPDGGSMYCPYIKNHKKPVFDDSVNAEWHSKAERFKAAGMGFTGLYEYYLCSTTPHYYHATMDVMKADLGYYLPELKYCYLDVPYNDNELSKPNENEQGWGGFGTCNLCYDMCGIEFWVASRLMWNPSIDVKEARREYCRRAFKGAEKIMGDYFEKLAEVYNNDPIACCWNEEPIGACKHYIVEKGLAGWVRETLAKAEKAATDPRSKELIKRHSMRMLPLIAKAELAPRTITQVVPQADGAPTSSDPADIYWRNAMKMAPLTQIGDALKPSDGNTAVYVRHDKTYLYILMDMKSKKYLEMYEAFEKDGKLGKNADMKGVFDWCNCVEMYLDGGLGKVGGYYHLCYMFNERIHSGNGPAALDNPPDWNVKITKREEGIRVLATIPLLGIGVEISKGNKINGNLVINNSSWNGGKHHNAAAFQTMQLEMK